MPCTVLVQAVICGSRSAVTPHNFIELPPIRSERPAFELHYPHMSARMRAEAHIGRWSAEADH